jgi:1,2-phenylacetyl-CoA epoxidase catalytic subunit
MASDQQLLDYLLRLADSDLILAQRLGEWVGHGPVLEEDIALTNVGLDLLGQARLWFAYASEVEGRIAAARVAAKTNSRSCATAAAFVTC